MRFRVLGDDEYRGTIADHQIELHAARLRLERYEVHGELTVTCGHAHAHRHRRFARQSRQCIAERDAMALLRIVRCLALAPCGVVVVPR